MIKYKN